MANKTIGELPVATTPLSGTELVHVVQSGNSRGAPINDVRGPILKSIADLTIAAGDLLVGLGTGLLGKLTKGAAGQILRVNSGATALEWTDKIALGTSQSASGTAVNFAGIPSTAREITLHLSQVSTNGGSNLLVQLGTSAGYESAGYNSAVLALSTGGNAVAASANGFGIYSTSAANAHSGNITFSLADLSANLWTASGALAQTNGPLGEIVTGAKAMPGGLDRIRLTTANGTDTFDAGTVNITWK